ncbi:unconventional prefoldin RPB5 interactor isoform X2 [Calliopsis andreniformis]|uniref:unconventional prefoldin RPB5 interactor isoform X2 n=1 Tax=Calliopsis andreniformis TaxID=337506 RepID=UPI003FCC649E
MMNYEDGTRNVSRILLDEAISQGIQKNEEQQKIWMAYKKGHLKVAEALCTLQKDLYVNCMVPIGKRALMKGRLIHTNEVLACLGDGYFAKYSVTGAAAVCERRIQTDEMLDNLGKEMNLYETRVMMIKNDVFENYANREIIEYWNEKEIDEWKKKHREKEREYHQKLATLRQDEKKKIETEEDLFHRLDELEIEEELADELNRLEDEHHELFGKRFEEDEYSDLNNSSDSEKEVSCEQEKCFVSTKHFREEDETYKSKKSVSFAEPENNVCKGKIEDSIKEDVSMKSAENSEEDIFLIEFRHSVNNTAIKSKNDTVETPADIYRIFSKPRSILKRSSNDIRDQIVPLDFSAEEEEEKQVTKPSAYETIVKDVKERDTIITDTIAKKGKETRSVSKFKRERQLK